MESSATTTAAAAREPLLRAPHRTQLPPLMGRSVRRNGPSAAVREAAAMQLEERRADWGYSRPVVAVDVAWNLAFAVATVAVLASAVRERPNVPVRVWVVGYALQCLVHVVMVLVEYRKRIGRRESVYVDAERGMAPATADVAGSSGDDEEEYVAEARGYCLSNVALRCESLISLVSFVWWVVGFYWVASGGAFLLQNAPKLYWLAVVFLAFDVFFFAFCVALACMIGIGLCCCLPCFIAVVYVVAGQKGASDEDIRILPRYRFRRISHKLQKIHQGIETMIPIGDCSEHFIGCHLLKEDADCCICLTSYEDGAELLGLPCNHHFRSSCIVKWLLINATCPLCKYNVLMGSEYE